MLQEQDMERREKGTRCPVFNFVLDVPAAAVGKEQPMVPGFDASV